MSEIIVRIVPLRLHTRIYFLRESEMECNETRTKGLREQLRFLYTFVTHIYPFRTHNALPACTSPPSLPQVKPKYYQQRKDHDKFEEMRWTLKIIESPDFTSPQRGIY
jgi:hypothetical protein